MEWVKLERAKHISSAKKLNEKELREFRKRFNIPIEDSVVETPLLHNIIFA